jgi:hypothetical protein
MMTHTHTHTQTHEREKKNVVGATCVVTRFSGVVAFRTADTKMVVGGVACGVVTHKYVRGDVCVCGDTASCGT